MISKLNDMINYVESYLDNKPVMAGTVVVDAYEITAIGNIKYILAEHTRIGETATFKINAKEFEDVAWTMEVRLKLNYYYDSNAIDISNVEIKEIRK